MYSHCLKPFFDCLISSVIIILISPLIIVVSLLLFIAYREFPFFLQARPGKYGQIFKVIKFRTMNNDRDSKGNLLDDGKRITAIGKFIRKTSLDELPQFINVLKGDMSLIGPRPLLVEYLHLYNDFQKRRHEIKPGITGWAQINGRNAISWEKKFELDVWYVDHLSFWLDVRILSITIMNVLRRKDINSGTAATMEKFNGEN
jgi:undecaprenyl phosphate N,N'-diacetylbacillosamine 1-phosphate transferase